MRWHFARTITEEEALSPHHRTTRASVGVVMWEILLEKAPYEQMDAVEAGQAIVEGKKLEIPAWAPAEYASLLSDCWHDDPALRPSFNDIYLRIEVPPSPPPLYPYHHHV